MSSPTKILITGVTGYIGSSILTQLLHSDNPEIRRSIITVVVRGEEKAKPFSEAGLNVVLIKDLDDSETLERAASENDIVIQAVIGFHPGSAVALIKGLGQRKATTGGDPKYIHTTGTSNLADVPLTTGFSETREFSDADSDLYQYIKAREAGLQYAQRTTDISVVETGKKVGVKTYLLMHPTIFGIGIGTVGKPNKQSIQIPALIRSAIKVGQSEVIGNGTGIWNRVHINDVVLLYELLLGRLLENAPLPYGDKGYFFSANGSFTWKELAERIAYAGSMLGALKTNEVKTIGLEEAAEKWMGGDKLFTELNFASNSRTTSVRSKELGWRPKKGDADWEKDFMDEFKIILAESQS